MVYPCAFCVSRVSSNWWTILITIDGVQWFIEGFGCCCNCLFTQIPEESRSFEMDSRSGLKELYKTAVWFFSVWMPFLFFSRCLRQLIQITQALLWFDSSLRISFLLFQVYYNVELEGQKSILLNPVRIKGRLCWTSSNLPADFSWPTGYVPGRCLTEDSIFGCVIHCNWCCPISLVCSPVFPMTLPIPFSVGCPATWSSPCAAACFARWYVWWWCPTPLVSRTVNNAWQHCEVITTVQHAASCL